MSPRHAKQDFNGEGCVNTRARAKRQNYTIDFDKEHDTTIDKLKNTKKKRKSQTYNSVVSETNKERSPKLTPSIDPADQTDSSKTDGVVLQLFYNNDGKKKESWLDRTEPYSAKTRGSTTVHPTKTPVKPSPTRKFSLRSPAAVNRVSKGSGKGQMKTKPISKSTSRATALGISLELSNAREKILPKIKLPNVLDKRNTPSKAVVGGRSSGIFKTDTDIQRVARRYSQISPTLLKNKSKTSLGNATRGVLTLSKSQKIVLRSPKSKAKKSKSPKALRTMAKRTRSLGERENSIGKRRSFGRRSVVTAVNHQSSFSSKPLKRLNKKTPKKESRLMDIIDARKPVVVLQRLTFVRTGPSGSKMELSSESSGRNYEKRTGNDVADAPMDLAKTPEIYTGSDAPRKSRSISKRHASIITDRETRSKSRNTSLNPSPSKLSAMQLSNNGDHDESTKETNKSVAPLMSSTPQEKERGLIERSVIRRCASAETNAKFSFSNPTGRPNRPRRPSFFDRSVLSKSDTYIKSTSIGNKLKKSLYKGDLKRANERNSFDGLYSRNKVTMTLEDTKRRVEKCNRTYEVLEPKTPKLREKNRKRGSNGTVDGEKESQANCKVRFASPGASVTGSANCKPIDNSNHGQSQTRYSENRHKFNIAARGNRMGGKPAMDDRQDRSPFNVRKHTNGSAKIEVVTPHRNDRKSTSGIGSSTTPFSSKKLDVKYSAKKNLPNFREIHKKLFAKAESIVEAKKRLEDRHIALPATKIKSLKTRTDTSRDLLRDQPTTNGVYNRFGFKSRKVEAANRILKKHHPPSRINRQRENRAILKGVRTNRRFELQMKCRNIEM